tara:strand:- start:2538 stop:3284 length:747 start_codon:yes stop_codon:yes gene_type:complete
MNNGILLCCHGTKSTKGTNDTKKLLKIFKEKNKDYIIKIGYLEIRKPSIKDQLEFFFKKKLNNLIIAPVMIFPGNHVTKDIPRIITSTKKKYNNLPKIFVTKPLVYSKDFFNTIQKNIKNLNRKKKIGLIVAASNTINFKAKNEINLLAKKVSKENKLSFYKSVLISLNKKKLKDELRNIDLPHDKLLVLPFFLFRGKLLKNLIFVIKELNMEQKDKFTLCNHLNNYKSICEQIINMINIKIHKNNVK